MNILNIKTVCELKSHIGIFYVVKDINLHEKPIYAIFFQDVVNLERINPFCLERPS